MYRVALFLHLLGALLFFGGITVAGIASELARRRRSAAEVAVLLSVARAGVLPVAVGGLMLPVFGLWLVHLGHWGYGTGWVDWALGLYVLAMLLGGLGGQRPRRARRRAVNYLSLLLVIAILALMVFKP